MSKDNSSGEEGREHRAPVSAERAVEAPDSVSVVLPERLWMANPKEGYAGNIVYRQQCSPSDVPFVRAEMFTALVAERDQLLHTLETRAEREIEMLRGVAEENDALRDACQSAQETFKVMALRGERTPLSQIKAAVDKLNAALATQPSGE